MTELHYEVMVHDGLRRHRDQRLPDGSPIVSSPVTSTLIFGERDAVLVDALLTTGQGERPAVWRKRLLTAAVMTAAAAWGGETDG